jgi:hypothetical protein
MSTVANYAYRTSYCTLLDALRVFDPNLDTADIESDEYLSANTLETVQSQLEGVIDTFESDTNAAFRETAYGQTGVRGSYHRLSKSELINEESRSRPTRFYLRPNLVPFDPDAGDELLIRTGPDSFDDITPDTTRYTVDWRRGEVELFDAFDRTFLRKRIGSVYRSSPVLVRYRYGAGGHRRGDAGETATAAQVDDTEGATVGIEDANRLPPNLDRPVLIGQREYARIDIDRSNDEITLTDRGLRGTNAVSHASGSQVHYCPMDIRQAVAYRTAEALNDWDFLVEWVSENVDYSDVEGRIQRASEVYDRAVANHGQNEW